MSVPSPIASGRCSVGKNDVTFERDTQQDRGADGNPPVSKGGQNSAPYPIDARDHQQDDGKEQGCRDRGAPQARRVAGQAEKRREMLEIPVEVEVAAEQARGCGIGQVEQGRRDHEQGQHKGEAASGNKTRTGQGRHRDQKEDTHQFGRGAPLCGDTVRHGVPRRQEKSGEEHYPKDSGRYRPDPCSRRCELRRGWCHRVPRAMS